MKRRATLSVAAALLLSAPLASQGTLFAGSDNEEFGGAGLPDNLAATPIDGTTVGATQIVPTNFLYSVLSRTASRYSSFVKIKLFRSFRSPYGFSRNGDSLRKR